MNPSIIWFAVFLLAMLLRIKSENAYMNRSDLIDAMFLYGLDCAENGRQRCVHYKDMESYEKTVLRLWDWGYTRILPPEKYEILKPYLHQLKEDEAHATD